MLVGGGHGFKRLRANVEAMVLEGRLVGLICQSKVQFLRARRSFYRDIRRREVLIRFQISVPSSGQKVRSSLREGKWAWAAKV